VNTFFSRAWYDKSMDTIRVRSIILHNVAPSVVMLYLEIALRIASASCIFLSLRHYFAWVTIDRLLRNLFKEISVTYQHIRATMSFDHHILSREDPRMIILRHDSMLWGKMLCFPTWRDLDSVVKMLPSRDQELDESTFANYSRAVGELRSYVLQRRPFFARGPFTCYELAIWSASFYICSTFVSKKTTM